MGKKKAKTEQPAYIQELLTNGTVTLTATDREDFGELIATIPAEVRYAAGAIGIGVVRDVDVQFLQRDVDLRYRFYRTIVFF